MKTPTAKDAKYGFGQLIDLARAETVGVANDRRSLVVVMAMEEIRAADGSGHAAVCADAAEDQKSKG
jgi:hypothetical protein